MNLFISAFKMTISAHFFLLLNNLSRTMWVVSQIKIALLLGTCMRTIAFHNEKGGVGKTTLATHIAAGLAIRGKRVLLVDADPQGHATVALGQRKEPMLHDLLVRDMPFQQAVRRVPPEIYSSADYQPAGGELLVIPSDISTRVIPLMTSDVMLVRNRFRELESVIDIIIFDTAPTPSLLHGSIYMTTDAIIYPTKCEFLSFDGLVESMKHKDEASKARQTLGLGEIIVGGIVPMMYRTGTQADDYGIEVLRERFGNLVWPAIKLRTVWNQASFARRTLFNFAPETKAAAEAWRMVEMVEAI
jgi:chromosome partitioning protein